ncbi:MAG: hypothetical protein IPI81_07130 [Flavobacteriales bacterium]|nr:hypothetical protein [Flavobacteriales bacterium]
MTGLAQCTMVIDELERFVVPRYSLVNKTFMERFLFTIAAFAVALKTTAL